MESEIINPDYKKAFEIAYWLIKGGKAELEQMVHKSKKGSDYYNGLLAGKKQAENEIRLEEISKLKNEQKEVKYQLGDTELDGEPVDPLYKNGFEHGYWLKKGDSPDLRDMTQRVAKSAHKSDGATNYYNGICDGTKQADKEKLLARIEQQFGTNKPKEPGKDLDFDR